MTMVIENQQQIVTLLEGARDRELFADSKKIKEQFVGKKTYLRGLIELSNICSKNCYYCGLRCSNDLVTRYQLKEEQVINAAKYAYEHGYGSLVIQSGERSDKKFISIIDQTLKVIRETLPEPMRITLSCGEQDKETYARWKELGADRYLLRIEASNPYLYKRLHPNDSNHSYEARLQALEDLRECGYQVGTGFMVGVPGQTLNDLASDILFLRDRDIDMIGLGPYLPSSNTPTAKENRMSDEERFQLALRVLAIVRIVLRDVNIAAATALQVLDPLGREKALEIAANVIMPNITTSEARKAYGLYDNKPIDSVEMEIRDRELFKRIESIGDQVVLNEFGDSSHFTTRMK